MAWRLLGRRCVRWPSMTLLGDLAQATAPAATAQWEDVIEHLGAPTELEVAELTVGYRVPGQLLDVANRLLPETGATVRPTGSVRVTPAPPLFVAVDAVTAGAVAPLVSELLERNTSVAVITPAPDAALRAELVDAGLPVADDAAARLVVLPAVEAKGLEFDAVVVIEPADVLDGGARGARLLYVALTRAVQELVVVHARPLPAALAAA
jgi:DNA helicase IV